MNPLLFFSPALSFVVALFLIRSWIPLARRVHLVGKDMNKPSKPDVAEVGGIGVLAGILGGILFYIFLNTFILNQKEFNLPLFATTTTIVIIALVGLTDDILGWKKGLKKWQKPVFTLPAALPMMVINAGVSSMAVPLLGNVDFGLLYPILIVPIGIVGASNGFNLLAGFNGLEAGMGIIMLSSLSIVTYITGSAWVTMIGVVSVAALLAFMIFNWYPAKIFPGNALTYMVGATIACMAILGNIEKIAVIIFIPYFIELILKARSKMKAECFAAVNADGYLNPPSKEIYSITHVALYILGKIKKQVREVEVTIFIFTLEVIFAIIGIAIYI